jgi:hypothetical protein
VDDEEMGIKDRGEAKPVAIPRVGAAQSRGPKPTMEDKHAVSTSGQGPDCMYSVRYSIGCTERACLEDARLPPPSPQIVASLLTGVDALVSVDASTPYWGVFDGHCGALAAELATAHLHSFLAEHKDVLDAGMHDRPPEEVARRAKQAFADAYARTEELILRTLEEEGRSDGTAALTCILLSSRYLCVANCGDARAVLGSLGESGVVAHRLSKDHKPNLDVSARRPSTLNTLPSRHSPSSRLSVVGITLVS